MTNDIGTDRCERRKGDNAKAGRSGEKLSEKSEKSGGIATAPGHTAVVEVFDDAKGGRNLRKAHGGGFLHRRRVGGIKIYHRATVRVSSNEANAGQAV
jgi:hypothetical protein